MLTMHELMLQEREQQNQKPRRKNHGTQSFNSDQHNYNQSPNDAIGNVALGNADIDNELDLNDDCYLEEDSAPQPFNYDPSTFGPEAKLYNQSGSYNQSVLSLKGNSRAHQNSRPNHNASRPNHKNSKPSYSQNNQKRAPAHIESEEQKSRKPYIKPTNSLTPEQISELDLSKMYVGEIQNFYRDKHHGFIRCPDLPVVTYFRHIHIQCEGVNFLIKQQRVQFKVEIIDEDRLCAVFVEPLELSPTQIMMQKNMKKKAEAEAAAKSELEDSLDE